MVSVEQPYGLSVADVQPGNTNEYVDGLVETYRQLGLTREVVATGSLATGSAAELHMESVEVAQ